MRVGEALGRAPKRPSSVSDLSFVAVGESSQGELAPISERHDDALAELE